VTPSSGPAEVCSALVGTKAESLRGLLIESARMSEAMSMVLLEDEGEEDFLLLALEEQL
jgi:hypothetical protein